ncbi:MAG: shikimate kinase [Steroidobacteraceae bacterium]
MRRVFLIGPMGSGKSAVGKRLARLLDWEFLDSDAEIERRTGVDIPFIFEKEGESGFRVREAAVIAELSQLDHTVLSTGGGAIMSAATRAILRERGMVVYLQTSVEQQARRVRDGASRPMVAGRPVQERLTELLQQREPLYLDTAHIVVPTDGRRVPTVAQSIFERLRASDADGGAAEQ